MFFYRVKRNNSDIFSFMSGSCRKWVLFVLQRILKPDCNFFFRIATVFYIMYEKRIKIIKIDNFLYTGISEREYIIVIHILLFKMLHVTLNVLLQSQAKQSRYLFIYLECCRNWVLFVLQEYSCLMTNIFYFVSRKYFT